MNRSYKVIPAVCVALMLLLSSGQPGTAQNSATQPELSEQLAALVRNKLEMIELETAGANEEWAGRYQSSDGPTVTTDFAWSPVSGFIVWWYNCSRPTSARANHGSVVFENGVLKLTPEVTESVPGSFAIASEYVPVRWGAQHFLIPQDQVRNFIYAINSNFEPEVESYLLKVDDNLKKRKGRPGVSSEYARYLGMKPILATISKVEPKTDQWYPNVTLNAGSRKGVITGMKFYRSPPRGPFTIFEVKSVAEHTAEAAIVLIANTNDKEAQLRRGWRLSSRAPKGSRRFLP